MSGYLYRFTTCYVCWRRSHLSSHYFWGGIYASTSFRIFLLRVSLWKIYPNKSQVGHSESRVTDVILDQKEDWNFGSDWKNGTMQAMSFLNARTQTGSDYWAVSLKEPLDLLNSFYCWMKSINRNTVSCVFEATVYEVGQWTNDFFPVTFDSTKKMDFSFFYVEEMSAMKSDIQCIL